MIIQSILSSFCTIKGTINVLKILCIYFLFLRTLPNTTAFREWPACVRSSRLPSMILEFLSGERNVEGTYAKVTRVAWHPRCENVWLRDISRRINGAIFLFSGTALTTLSPFSTARSPSRRPSTPVYTAHPSAYFILFYRIRAPQSR